MNRSLKESFEKLLLELNQIKESERGHLDTIHRRNKMIAYLRRDVKGLLWEKANQPLTDDDREKLTELNKQKIAR